MGQLGNGNSMHDLLLHPHQWKTYRFHHSILWYPSRRPSFPISFFFCVLKAFHLCCRKPQKLSSYKVFFHVVEGPVYPIFCLLMTPYFFVNLEQGNVKTFYPFWRNMKWLLAKLSIDRKLPYLLAEIPALR